MKARKLCKARGITQNYHASQLVNFDVIRAMILDQVEPVVNVHTESKMQRKGKAVRTVAIVTEPEDKQ